MMVREGFLEEVGLEESREKYQGMPAMQKRLREIEPARLACPTLCNPMHCSTQAPLSSTISQSTH